MTFNFKVTVWEEIKVPKEDEQKVLEAIKDGRITSSEDVYQFLDGSNFVDANFIEDTSEQMMIEENGFSATIEIENENRDIIYSNEQEKDA